MYRVRVPLLYGLLTAAAPLGCGGAGGANGTRTAEPAIETLKSDDEPSNVWVSCYRDFQPGSDPAADLARLASACGKPAGLTAATPARVGESQPAEAPPERFEFLGRAGRCYRIFAVGAPEVADLDIAIIDEDGRLAAADASRDRWPVVPTRGALCLRRDERFTVHIGVIEGSGGYVMQVWAAER